MDIKDIRKMNKEEIAKELEEKQAALRDMKFKLALEEHSQVRDYRKLRKEVAQMLTILKEMDKGINKPEEKKEEEPKKQVKEDKKEKSKE